MWIKANSPISKRNRPNCTICRNSSPTDRRHVLQNLDDVPIPELRNKIILTFVLLAVYRLGFAIPLPFIDQEQLASFVEEASGGGNDLSRVMTMISLFSATDIGMSTIFGLGIMPYISASIIFQLLATVYPPLEKLQKEGEAGRKKINEYTRYATVVICLGQSLFWMTQLASAAGILGSGHER